MSLRREYQEAIHEALAAAGVDYTVEVASGHRKYRFVHNGKKCLFVTPCTPSDPRGVLNAMSDLRKILGGRRRDVTASTPQKHKRKRNRKRPIIVESITPGKDPWEPLRRLHLKE